ncbi:MAG TPA: DUF3617 family protein [Acidobacteriaceae bacterium]|nr:DUF3617 family protein [Acidobacteriaceae bacterium]
MSVCKVSLALSALIAASPFVQAQDRKPGLYDVTLTTTSLQPSQVTYPPHTIQACLTPEMIEKYGAIVPEDVTRICKVTNVKKGQGNTLASLVCTGSVEGKGTLKVVWTDGEHTKGQIQFAGVIRPNGQEIKVEWNTETASVYKGPDCGALAPPPAQPSPAPGK